jgi:hypothetical protein
VKRLLAAALAACGAGARPAVAPPEAPARAATAGDALLALLPPAPDAIAELDVARLRANPVAGDVLAAVPRAVTRGFDPRRDVDVAVAGVYRIAADEAATLILLRGDGLDRARLLDAKRIDDRTVALGPAELRARAGSGAPSAPPPELLALRAAAMPERAGGAVLRVAARLTREARIGAAGRLGVDEVPATVSVWLDVADDAAMIALLGGDDAANAERLARGVDAARGRLAVWLPPAVLDGLRVETRGSTARLVWVVPPRRLARWAEQLVDQLRAREG